MKLEATELNKSFGQITAVNSLNLTLENEFFVFLGPNGAGKTTTIKMMTGLLHPTSGIVKIDGYDIQKQPVEAKRLIGFVPEEPFLYKKLSAREYLNFISKLYQIDAAVAERRIRNYFDLFEINNRANDLIQNFSHGMTRKVALIAALLHEPKLLFLDEPTVGLDPKSAHNLKELLKGLIDKGTTIFMTTHILEIAENMGQRIGIIHKGNLIANGTKEDLERQSGSAGDSLESIFLELTDSQDKTDVTRILADES